MGQFDIAVIGGGIAGLTAVQHALLAGCSVVHLIGVEPIGGLVCNVGELSGFAGGGEPVSGIDLAAALLSANAAGGVSEIVADAMSVVVDADRFCITYGAGEIFAHRVIVATGARLRMLDVPGAHELVGRGVSQCAWCDGSLYEGKHAVVVGGGDAALEEALHLANFASRVTVVARTRLTGRQAYIDRVTASQAIDVREMCEVREILGDQNVSAVRLRDHGADATEDFGCDGVFVFIGLDANSGVFADLATLDGSGRIETDQDLQTRTPGLFAVGAVRAGYGGRLAQAVGEAATAAIAAARQCRS